jgi:uncharacterized protein YceH (UPF0502 family)
MMEFAEHEDALILTAEEARVLGCLMEKAVTTPDAYPLTFNGLVAACNQKTNRDPVVSYDDDIVAEAVEGLRGKHLLYRVDGAGSRVQKYKHRIDERLGLMPPSQALLTVLLLRGAQTSGELRTRSERMYSFVNTAAVEAEIAETAEDIEIPLWRRFERAPGQKEARYMHLLFGANSAPERSATVAVAAAAAIEVVQQRNERIDQLEERVELLETELAELRGTFAEFRKQFE